MNSGLLQPIVLESPRLLLQNKRFQEQHVQTEEGDELNFLTNGTITAKMHEVHVHRPVMATDLKSDFCSPDHQTCVRH